MFADNANGFRSEGVTQTLVMEQHDGWCEDLIERDSALSLAAAEVPAWPW